MEIKTDLSCPCCGESAIFSMGLFGNEYSCNDCGTQFSSNGVITEWPKKSQGGYALEEVVNINGTRLYPHGIQKEESEFRLHIGIEVVPKAFLFQTKSAIRQFNSEPYSSIVLPTAIGYLIPWKHIDGCQDIRIPPELIEKYDFRESDGLAEKGEKAEGVGAEMVNQQLFDFEKYTCPSPVIESVTNRDDQIKGIDLRLKPIDRCFEIKCDWPATRTGNLFIQTHERNPDKIGHR